MRVDNQPIEEAICQTATMPTGKNQGATRNNHLFVGVAIGVLLNSARLYGG